MVSTRQKSILMVLITSLVVFAFAGCDAKAPMPTLTPKTFVVTDAAGRAVEIPQPLERVVWVDGYSGLFINALGVSNSIFCGISWLKDDVPLFDYIYGKTSVGRIPDIGWAWPPPSVEKILELRPQLVLCDYVYLRARDKECGPFEQRLNDCGVKFIYVKTRGYEDTREYTDSVKLLGKIFNAEKGAQELIDFERKYIALIEENLKGLRPEEKVRLYISYGWAFDRSDEYQTFSSKSCLNAGPALGGGINIMSDVEKVEKGTVTPEELIKRNPQVIVRMGPWPYSIKWMGFGVSDTDSRLEALRQKMMKLPGWESIDAVKNNRLYLVSLEANNLPGLAHSAGMFAKILHPERFRDVKVEDIPREWVKKFIGFKEAAEGFIIYPEPK